MSLPKSLRFEILARDGFCCRYCGVSASERELHVDHVLPLSHGGGDTVENLVAACNACNFGKSDRKLIGLPDGFAMSKDMRPARLAKAQKSGRDTKRHRVEFIIDEDYSDPSEDGTDSIGCMLWCSACEKPHFDYVPKQIVENGFAPFETDRKFNETVGWLLDWRPQRD